jgi:hypothetical protein
MVAAAVVWAALLKRRASCRHPVGDCCGGSCLGAHPGVRTSTTPSTGAGEGGAALVRSIGPELPDTAAVASMPGRPEKGRKSLGADRGL